MTDLHHACAKTPVETLRETARRMREEATAATRGPWVPYPTNIDHDGGWTVSRPYCDRGLPEGCDDDCGLKVFSTGAEGCEEDNITQADAYYIASMHPGVALAVAHWLDDTALTMRCDGCSASERSCSFAQEFQRKCCPDCGHGQAALAVARAYLGPEVAS